MKQRLVKENFLWFAYFSVCAVHYKSMLAFLVKWIVTYLRQDLRSVQLMKTGNKWQTEGMVDLDSIVDLCQLCHRKLTKLLILLYCLNLVVLNLLRTALMALYNEVIRSKICVECTLCCRFKELSKLHNLLSPLFCQCSSLKRLRGRLSWIQYF